MNDYIALGIVAICGLSLGLFGLIQARKLREERQREKDIVRQQPIPENDSSRTATEAARQDRKSE